MTTFLLFMLLLSLTGIAGTIRLLVGGGRGHAPGSHACDSRFQPPATRLS